MLSGYCIYMPLTEMHRIFERLHHLGSQEKWRTEQVKDHYLVKDRKIRLDFANTGPVTTE